MRHIKIDATQKQCDFLNEVAETTRRYVRVLKSIQEDVQETLDDLPAGHVSKLRSQDLTQVAELAAKLDMLHYLSGTIFDFPEDAEDRSLYAVKVNEWYRDAMDAQTGRIHDAVYFTQKTFCKDTNKPCRVVFKPAWRGHYECLDCDWTTKK